MILKNYFRQADKASLTFYVHQSLKPKTFDSKFEKVIFSRQLVFSTVNFAKLDLTYRYAS